MRRKDLAMAYFKAWGQADAKAILATCTSDFVLDDPDAGPVTSKGLHDFVVELRKKVPGGKPPFVVNTDILGNEDWSTVSCWWSLPGTNICGSGLLKISDQGVMSEKVAYYTR